jgi:hypothetical protein
LFDAEERMQLALYPTTCGGRRTAPEEKAMRRACGNLAESQTGEVGFLWSVGPDGGARPEALWVKCL